MSTIAGAWSESTLQAVRMRADALMFDDRIKLQYAPQIAVLNSIDRLQTADVTPLKARNKDYTVEVEWINACGIEAEDCVACEVGGPELSANIETYTLDKCKQAGFSIYEDTLATNDFGPEEAVAKGFLRAEAVILEAVAQDYLATLVAAAGVNTWNAAGEIGTVVGAETQIAAADYDAEAIAYLTKVGTFNRFTNPVMLSGNVLYNAWQQARFNAGNDNGKGDLARFSSMEWFWDLYNFNQAGIDDLQLMISTGSVAFASRGRYSETIENWQAEGERWTMPAVMWPKLQLEVAHKIGCRNDRKTHEFMVKGNWANLVNPAGCDLTNTGILVFRQV